MEKIDVESDFVELKQFPKYQILNQFPFTIRKADSGFVIRTKSKKGYISIYLDSKDRSFHHVIAAQFLNLKDGDRVRFKKRNTDQIDINDYKLDNLVVIKNNDSDDSDPPVRGKVIDEEPVNHRITWNDVKEHKIDIKDDWNISNLIEFSPFKVGSYNGDLDIVRTMRHVFATVHSTPEIFIFKDQVKDGFKLSYTNEATAKQKLNKIIIGHIDRKPISALDIYMKYTELFTFNFLSFYSKDSKAFSYFRGYDYTEVKEINEELINPFLNHVKEVICDNDERLDKYVNNWFAEILQKPDCKLQTALTLIGEQGTGKNVFTDVLCKLLGIYACDNINDIDDIAGKFNAAIENKKLIVCNELQSADQSRNLNSDKLKSIITDKSLRVNEKFEPKRQTDNVANFIFVSNHLNPLKMESKDRRYCVMKVSEKYCQNTEYFGNLCSGFTKEFYKHLFTYYMQRDISNYNHREIPMTDAKEFIMNANKDMYKIFVEEFHQMIDNISGPDLYELWKEFADDAKFIYTRRSYETGIQKYTGKAKSIWGKKDKKMKKMYDLLPNIREEMTKMFPIEKQERVEDHKDHDDGY